VRSIRFHVDRVTPQLDAEVRELYGPAARVVGVQEVLTGGVGGFFARRRFEVEVRLSAEPMAPAPVAMHDDLPAAGLAELLEQAERAEARDRIVPSPLSTESSAFESVLADLGDQVGARIDSTPPIVVAPVLASAPGSLVVIAGLGRDAISARDGMLAGLPAIAAVGGALDDDGLRADDRRSALAARGSAVAAGEAAVVAYGLGDGLGLGPHLVALRALSADQLWVAVDVSRKHEDTARWVGALREDLPVSAVAVVRGAHTSTPDSVEALGLAIGWRDAVR
jgi:hypothetical protein